MWAVGFKADAQKWRLVELVARDERDRLVVK
jgi:hypothetical protein